jgi:hypothetical protein
MPTDMIHYIAYSQQQSSIEPTHLHLNEADVLARDVSNVVQKTATDNIANLLNRCLWVNVTEMDGSVAKVVYTTSTLEFRPPGRATATTAQVSAAQVSIFLTLTFWWWWLSFVGTS